MTSVSVGVPIPSNLYERLLAHTSKVKVSRSEVVISALANYLGRESCNEYISKSP
jgi:metal-responsive CopG/Arc/MetJ family transcriptional regulator